MSPLWNKMFSYICQANIFRFFLFLRGRHICQCGHFNWPQVLAIGFSPNTVITGAGDFIVGVQALILPIEIFFKKHFFKGRHIWWVTFGGKIRTLVRYFYHAACLGAGRKQPPHLQPALACFLIIKSQDRATVPAFFLKAYAALATAPVSPKSAIFDVLPPCTLTQSPFCWTCRQSNEDVTDRYRQRFKKAETDCLLFGESQGKKKQGGFKRSKARNLLASWQGFERDGGCYFCSGRSVENPVSMGLLQIRHVTKNRETVNFFTIFIKI